VPEPRHLIDASVVAKWFNRGESHEQEAFGPSHIVYEICNSIWKKSNVDRELASSLSKLVVRLAPTLLNIGEAESSEPMDMVRKNKLTFYDAVYIVPSTNQKCR